jgi:cell fate (sporulation/competence/biofilm development) regulator YlbF (YheA/YmcA/DUF963 family)
MIVTENLFNIEDQTEALLAAIFTSEVFREYKSQRKKMQCSTEVQQLQADFAKAKADFERVEAYGIHAPDFREKQRAVRKAKRMLDMNDNVAAFRVSETALQTLLDTIGLEIAHKVSDNIKVDAGNPFFVKGNHSGCGGGCHAS